MPSKFDFKRLSSPSNYSDRLGGLQLIFGKIENPIPSLKIKSSINKNWGIAIQDNGINENYFHDCFLELSQQFQSSDFAIIQSGKAQDKCWYIIGDINKFIEMAKTGQAKTPISKFALETLGETFQKFVLEHNSNESIAGRKL